MAFTEAAAEELAQVHSLTFIGYNMRNWKFASLEILEGKTERIIGAVEKLLRPR